VSISRNADQRSAVAAKKDERARDAALAMREYEAEKLAVHAKTARLRALRLAKEAEQVTPERKPGRNTSPMGATQVDVVYPGMMGDGTEEQNPNRRGKSTAAHKSIKKKEVQAAALVGPHGDPPLEHDPEKWVPVFGKDHAPARS
jgi:hypothetical protein